MLNNAAPLLLLSLAPGILAAACGRGKTDVCAGHPLRRTPDTPDAARPIAFPAAVDPTMVKQVFVSDADGRTIAYVVQDRSVLGRGRVRICRSDDRGAHWSGHALRINRLAEGLSGDPANLGVGLFPETSDLRRWLVTVVSDSFSLSGFEQATYSYSLNDASQELLSGPGVRGGSQFAGVARTDGYYTVYRVSSIGTFSFPCYKVSVREDPEQPFEDVTQRLQQTLRGNGYSETDEGDIVSCRPQRVGAFAPSTAVVECEAGGTSRDGPFLPERIGLFATTDRGANWTGMSWPPDSYVPAGRYLLALDSLVASPEERPVWYANYDTVGDGRRIVRSADLGQTWETRAVSFAGKLAVSPVHPDTVYLAGVGGLYKTTDGWQSASRLMDGGEWSSDVRAIQTPAGAPGIVVLWLQDSVVVVDDAHDSLSHGARSCPDCLGVQTCGNQPGCSLPSQR